MRGYLTFNRGLAVLGEGCRGVLDCKVRGAFLLPFPPGFLPARILTLSGEAAEGSRKAPSLLADPVQQATPGTLFWILTNGVVRRGMPVWSKLPEPERWQIV